MTGVLWFAVALAIHRFLWIRFKPSKEIFFLFILFFGIFPAVQRVLEVSGRDGAIYLCLALSYVMSYPALKIEIPTFRILLLIDGQKGEGITEEEIVARLGSGTELFEDRVEELERDAFVDQKDGRLFLKPTGRALSTIFILYRRLLGKPAGAG